MSRNPEIHVFTTESLHKRDMEIASKIHQMSVLSTTRKLNRMTPGQVLRVPRWGKGPLLADGEAETSSRQHLAHKKNPRHSLGILLCADGVWPLAELIGRCLPLLHPLQLVFKLPGLIAGQISEHTQFRQRCNSVRQTPSVDVELLQDGLASAMARSAQWLTPTPLPRRALKRWCGGTRGSPVPSQTHLAA